MAPALAPSVGDRSDERGGEDASELNCVEGDAALAALSGGDIGCRGEISTTFRA